MATITDKCHTITALNIGVIATHMAKIA